VLDSVLIYQPVTGAAVASICITKRDDAQRIHANFTHPFFGYLI